VERAERCTVRELEAAVRRARSGEDPDEDWVRFGARLDPDERVVVDGALAIAGELMPGASRLARLEALAQEALAAGAHDPDAPPALGAEFRPLGGREAERRSALEAESEAWAALEPLVALQVPDFSYDDLEAHEVDARLRAIARVRRGWDAVLGYFAAAVKRSGLHLRLGFASFRHFVEERLGLDAKAVEQRARLEERLWRSPELREARRQRLSYERLRLLARLPEGEIASWIARAKALTVIALRRRLEGEEDRKMRAQGRLGVAMPRGIAVTLAAALQVARRAVGAVLPTGKALAVVAAHFVDVWGDLSAPRRTPSREARERDGGHCQVPGCSHAAAHAHHIVFRSRGGGDERWNMLAGCAFHHLRCIHEHHLSVEGEAPDGLVWKLHDQPWPGPGLA
jgi:hypothetical protein